MADGASTVTRTTPDKATTNDDPAPDIGRHSDLNTDERAIANWGSRYPSAAIDEIRFDTKCVSGIFLLTFIGLVCTWNGLAFRLMAYGCVDCSSTTFSKYAYFFLGGLLGGILFGIKYLYKVVAHGLWNIDRRLWRIFSPFLAGGLAVAVGTLIDSGILGLANKPTTGASYVAIGFMTGYFADSALAKMQEIAKTVFGTPERR